jgi:hypothetical protein
VGFALAVAFALAKRFANETARGRERRPRCLAADLSTVDGA